MTISTEDRLASADRAEENAPSAPNRGEPGSPPRRDGVKRTRGARQQALTGWMFMAPFAVLFIIVFLVPIVVSIYSSMFAQLPSGDGLYGGGGLVDTFVGFDNFALAIGSARSGQEWDGSCCTECSKFR